MPIARKRHEEVTADGSHVYVIKCTVPTFEGRRYKTKFYNGEARTKFEEKAKLFSEVLGYQVFLHKDAKPWKEVNGNTPPSLINIEDETSSYTIDSEDSAEEEELG